MKIKELFAENYPLTLLIVWVMFPFFLIGGLIFRPLQYLLLIPPLWTFFSPMILLAIDGGIQ